MADAKMVSLKRTPEDKRKDAGEVPGIEAVAPDYPWGLCLHLDYDELEKLGITQLPEIGKVMTLTAKVKVTRRTETAAEAMPGGDPDESKSIDLQITDASLA